MARIEGVNAHQIQDEYISKVFAAQACNGDSVGFRDSSRVGCLRTARRSVPSAPAAALSSRETTTRC
jgi:hypothetical protein